MLMGSSSNSRMTRSAGCSSSSSSITVNRRSQLPFGPSSLASSSLSCTRRNHQRIYTISPSNTIDPEDSDEAYEELLLEEEDFTVPGGANDSLSPNTKLGQAIRQACDELEHLSNMEMDSLVAADELLRKLGVKSSIFGDKVRE